MKNEKRHEMNLGAEAERKALRGIVARLYKQHILDICARDSIWKKLSLHVAAATNDISRAHLEAAAEGFGHEAIHRIANSLLTGDATHLHEEIDAVHAIGHTSGWDALVGVVMTLNVWLETQGAR